MILFYGDRHHQNDLLVVRKYCPYICGGHEEWQLTKAWTCWDAIINAVASFLSLVVECCDRTGATGAHGGSDPFSTNWSISGGHSRLAPLFRSFMFPWATIWLLLCWTLWLPLSKGFVFEGKPTPPRKKKRSSLGACFKNRSTAMYRNSSWSIFESKSSLDRFLKHIFLIDRLLIGWIEALWTFFFCKEYDYSDK